MLNEMKEKLVNIDTDISDLNIFHIDEFFKIKQIDDKREET